MKKLLLIATIAAMGFAKDLLPQNFGQCNGLTYFTPQNAPIPLKDTYIDIKKYDCDGKIIYIGIQNEIPGILKINVNKDTKDFLIKHCNIEGYNTAVYVDKNLQKGVLAVQLDDKHTLKILFKGTDYKSIGKILQQLDLDKIKSELS